MLKLATKFAPQSAAFETAHRAGFRCAELWLDAGFLDDWENVAALARHYPFEYVLHFPNRLDLPAEAPEQAVRLYRALGCRCLVIHPPLLDRYGEALRRLDPGLACAVENLGLTPNGFARWAEENNHLTLDVEHLWLMTLGDVPRGRLLEEVRTFLRRYGEKLRHVHLPGYVQGFPTHRPMYCSRDLVFGIFDLLAEHRFEGLVVSEALTEYQNAQELRMDVLLFDRWRERRTQAERARP
jgi:sugar phosphate isomerase/epimerase